MKEIEFKILRVLSVEGNISQRELSRKAGLSLGSINFVLREFSKRGYIKTERIKNVNNKIAYMYILTPHGINMLVHQARILLEQKIGEFEKLKHEIEELEKRGISLGTCG